MHFSTPIALSLLGLACAAAPPPPAETPVAPFAPKACPASSPRAGQTDHWHYIYTRLPVPKPQCAPTRAVPSRELLASWLRESCNTPCGKEGGGTKFGDTLLVNYNLTLNGWGGKPVDSTYSATKPNGDPFSFKLGAHQVISGFDASMHNMCPGETRVFKITGEGGYGSKGAPPVIPSCSDLYFRVNLVSFTSGNATAEKPT